MPEPLRLAHDRPPLAHERGVAFGQLRADALLGLGVRAWSHQNSFGASCRRHAKRPPPPAVAVRAETSRMTYRTAIDIDAPVERVWEVLMDVERWPDWSPTMTSVERLEPGMLRPGSSAR